MAYEVRAIRVDPGNNFGFSFNGHMLAEVWDDDAPESGLKLFYNSDVDSLILLRGHCALSEEIQTEIQNVELLGIFKSPEELAEMLGVTRQARNLYETLKWDFCHPLDGSRNSVEVKPVLVRSLELVSWGGCDFTQASIRNSNWKTLLTYHPKFRAVWDNLIEKSKLVLTVPSLVYTLPRQGCWDPVTDLNLVWQAGDPGTSSYARFALEIPGDGSSLTCRYQFGSWPEDTDTVSWPGILSEQHRDVSRALREVNRLQSKYRQELENYWNESPKSWFQCLLEKIF